MRLVQHNIYVEGEKYARIKRLAARQRISVGTLLRHALGDVLELAERQANTTDKAQALHKE